MNKRRLRSKVRRLEREKVALTRELFVLQANTNRVLAMLEASLGIPGVKP